MNMNNQGMIAANFGQAIAPREDNVSHIFTVFPGLSCGYHTSTADVSRLSWFPGRVIARTVLTRPWARGFVPSTFPPVSIERFISV